MYKLAKFYTQLINRIIDLHNAFNTKTSSEIMKNLRGIFVDDNGRLASFDITNTYSNILTARLK